jgi:tRNA dimethylallyltransferase
VETLLGLGYGRDLKPMQAIGYRQIGAYLHGELPLDHAVELIKRDTRRYAKRQWTWFRGDPEVRWITGKRPLDEALAAAKNFLKV